MNWKLKAVVSVAALTVFLTGCMNSGGMGGMDHSKMNMGGNKEESTSENTKTSELSATVLTGKSLTLKAQVSNQEIAPGVTLPVWTFNNSVPGPELRIKQGEMVNINLVNELPDPVSIHWHGVPLPNDMDGIPGVTQNAVQPGESFVYKFKADVPGTYWYHSHQDSANQLDRGLYGSFIVEDSENEKVDRDYSLILDEWNSKGTMDMDEVNMSDNSMEGMDHSQMNMSEESNTMDMKHDMSMYDLFTINGKSSSLVSNLNVKEGEKVRIRLTNAGFISHQIHLHGHEFRITATDGQPVNKPGIVKESVIAIAPGERYDIEFEANNPGQWYIEDHGDNAAVKGMKALITYEGISENSDKANDLEALPVVDMTQYGENGQRTFSLEQKYTLDYTMNLNTELKNNKTVYTINGATFPETEAIKVKKGDTVKVKMINNSKSDDHPMHLHGHFFQVLSKNGKAITGAPLMKDTLNLKPGEEYVVAFKADNEGNWMFHCHDLHHAASGMVTQLLYTDYKTDFVPDPKAGNKPE
ncbi:copper oxidase [Paenibacillus sp. FSL A5-0031]|nr:copper oxidase [Paenibacillus sp. FSL A5-0031]